MKLELKTNTGKKATFVDFGKNGDEIRLELVNEYNQKKIYTLRVTASGRMVMN